MNGTAETTPVEKPDEPVTTKTDWKPFILAGLLLSLLFAIHLGCCQNSVLPYIVYLYKYSDMHANVLWAQTILDQGWMNPQPHHPYTDWMQHIAPYPQWVKWWGGEQIYQQSPLFTYLLAAAMAVSKNLLFARIGQAVLAAGLCALLGLLTWRLAGRAAGWVAFILAALYAPFYAHSWELLRDVLAWFLTAALLLALGELSGKLRAGRENRWLCWTVGALLGLGYLARETYMLIIPVVWIVLALQSWRTRSYACVARVVLATVLTTSPLLVRNYCVNAPLFVTSNRFNEMFITGHSYTAHPYMLVMPAEMGQILYDSGGKPGAVIRAVWASHPDGWRGWARLQFGKLRALLDPFEPSDNLSIYFVARISPVVRFGLKYWLIVVPGLGGLTLTLWRRDWQHIWLWLVFPILVTSVLVGNPVSRYRQFLAVLLIPWAACFLVHIANLARQHRYKPAGALACFLLTGWWLVSGPLAFHPRSEYERPAEYQLAVNIHERLGETQKAQQMRELLHEKFPEKFPAPAPILNGTRQR